MIQNLTKLYKSSASPDIMGRDEELEQLMITLLRFEKPNAIITGPAGVGKTSLVHMLAYMIANELVPDGLLGFSVLEVNTNALLAGDGYRGVTEAKFQKLIDEAITNGKVILFMDEFHTVVDLGKMANGSTPGLSNTLKPYLTRADFRIIGATTTEEFATINDPAFLRRFFRLQMSEPSDEVVTRIITSCIKKYGRGTRIQQTIIGKILSYSKSLPGYNPDKAKDIVDFLFSYCIVKEIKTVTEDVLVTVFDRYFQNLPKADKIPEKLPEAELI